MSSGERPIGAARGKQSDTEALCQPPPPPHTYTAHKARARTRGMWPDQDRRSPSHCTHSVVPLVQGAKSGLMLMMKASGPKLFDYVGYVFQLLFHGLRSVMGPGLVDYPRLWLMYDVGADFKPRTPEQRNRKRRNIYGCGFSYGFRLGSDADVDRRNLTARIRAREFAFVVYPMRKPPNLKTWTLLYWPLVCDHPLCVSARCCGRGGGWGIGATGGRGFRGGDNVAGKISRLRKVAKLSPGEIFAACGQQLHCEFRCS